jgi:methylenetetrahydrofolate dehydrogenase (NADP+)/methenyltetrahydrofolate cyclohydrolase
VPARRLDGAAVAAEIRAELAPRVVAFTAARGRPPGLAVVLAGQRPESEIYVRNKIQAVGAAGCRGTLHRLDDTASLDAALDLINRLNRDDEVDAILVQSPLPGGMGRGAEQRVFDAIDPRKDVDGFHPENAGRLVQKRPTLVACTPLGCIELLERERVPIAGQSAVVTVCHSRTQQLARVCSAADIVVAAIGRAGFVTREFIKPGATVIDVGINVLTTKAEVDRFFPADSRKQRTFETKGSVLVGDVHPGAAEVAGAITPVPGGVGPLTIAMVLRNTITAAELRV